MHWVNPTFEMKIGEIKEFDIRIRYRQSLRKGKLIAKENGFYILFYEKERGITPGQFAAFYYENELVASGVIAH
jgi:tRNA-specific 2-thiouridylase